MFTVYLGSWIVIIQQDYKNDNKSWSWECEEELKSTGQLR